MNYKHFIGAITALAISITGLTAVPVRASDDTAKIVTGLAALAIVGAAISSAKDDDDHAYVSKSYNHKPYYYGKKRHGGYRYKSHGHHRHKLKHHRKHKKHHYKAKRHHFKKRYYRK